MSDTSTLPPLPVESWDESLVHIAEDMNGCPLNVHKLMANHPQLLNAWWPFRNYGVRGGELTQRQRELVILRVAWRLRVWYEWASHVERGLKAGLTQEEIERVKSEPETADWSEIDGLLLRAVDESIDQHQISLATKKLMADHFTDQQVMDIIAIQGMYVILGAIINTWGLVLDECTKLPEDLSREGFE